MKNRWTVRKTQWWHLRTNHDLTSHQWLIGPYIITRWRG